ncbi:hypothetical protein L9F63_023827 [Diploptera punctata]|uniref:C-type lectin domain-containing protein n=1 Tax=Diploptera punctata TaxID=6984 RepID=A0AAD8E8W9_DIPPU|nr:hypothetical protein L9F63_023827 [Diploptera punctata]
MKYLVLLSIVACALAAEVKDGQFFVVKEPSGVNSEFRWNEAYSMCSFKGGRLPVINSEAEAQAVAKLMKENDILDYVHVGFTDLFAEGHYLTIDDQTLTKAGYSNWANGYPNGGRTSNCGAINAKGELLDISCYTILNVICESN